MIADQARSTPGRTRRASIVPDDETGSVLPLIVGYAVIALVLILVCMDATSLYLAHRRADTVADAAAVAAAGGYAVASDGSARVRLRDDAVRARAQRLIARAEEDARLVSARTPDGRSAQVSVDIMWHPPIMTLFVPEGVRVHARAVSRSALH